MTREQYDAIEQARIDIAQLSMLLAFVARGVGDGKAEEAIEACGTLAQLIADRFDSIPGFLDAQIRRSRPE